MSLNPAMNSVQGGATESEHFQALLAPSIRSQEVRRMHRQPAGGMDRQLQPQAPQMAEYERFPARRDGSLDDSFPAGRTTSMGRVFDRGSIVHVYVERGAHGWVLDPASTW